jgi:hypothetical protein
VVAGGVGCDLDERQLFNDKEWMVTDNNRHSPFYGRTYLTWSRFESASGNYQASPIFSAWSDNGGKSWSRPREISGANERICTFQTAGGAGRCDENQFSVPTVQPDGTVVVAFQNSQNTALYESAEEFDKSTRPATSTPTPGPASCTWCSPTTGPAATMSPTRSPT